MENVSLDKTLLKIYLSAYEQSFIDSNAYPFCSIDIILSLSQINTTEHEFPIDSLGSILCPIYCKTDISFPLSKSFIQLPTSDQIILVKLSPIVYLLGWYSHKCVNDNSYQIDSRVKKIAFLSKVISLVIEKKQQELSKESYSYMELMWGYYFRDIQNHLAKISNQNNVAIQLLKFCIYFPASASSIDNDASNFSEDLLSSSALSNDDFLVYIEIFKAFLDSDSFQSFSLHVKTVYSNDEYSLEIRNSIDNSAMTQEKEAVITKQSLILKSNTVFFK